MNLIISEDPPPSREYLFVGYYIKMHFLGINFKSFPGGGGSLPPSGILAQTYSSGKKCISKEGRENDQNAQYIPLYRR